MNRTCLSCGAPLSDTAKFCRGCGTPVTLEDPAAAVAISAEQTPPEKSREKGLCVKCGAVLSPGAKFCRGCGTPVILEEPAAAVSIPIEQIPPEVSPGERQCAKCGAVLSSGAKFCRGCGALVTPENGMEAAEASGPGGKPESAAGIASAAGQAVKTFMASPKSGTFTLLTGTPPAVLTNAAAKATSAIELLSPFKVLINGLTSTIKGIKEAGKNKKALLTAILFGIGWLVLTLLPALGISVPSWLNFLTFANGGLTGGIAGFIGGLLGKGLIVSLIAGAVSGNWLPKIGQKTKDSEQKTEIPNALGLTLAGVGTALILYNFMSGDGSPENSMVGIAAAITAYRSQKQGGFLYKLADSFSARLSKATLPSDARAGRFTIGLTTGFALGVPLSLLGISWICYLLGLLVCVVGVVLSITATGSAGVAQQQ